VREVVSSILTDVSTFAVGFCSIYTHLTILPNAGVDQMLSKLIRETVHDHLIEEHTLDPKISHNVMCGVDFQHKFYLQSALRLI